MSTPSPRLRLARTTAAPAARHARAGRDAAARLLLLALLALLALLLLLADASAPCAATCPQQDLTPPPASDLATCEPYQNQLPEDGAMGFCVGIVDYPYYLPHGYKQRDLENQLLSHLSVRSGSPFAPSLATIDQKSLMLSILPDSCLFQLKKALCMAAFMPCEYVDPFFVDGTCGASATCTKCGSNPAGKKFNISNTDPAYIPDYGSTCNGKSNLCVVAPGAVPGSGYLSWAAVFAAQAQISSALTPDVICSKNNLVYNATTNSCLKAVPRTPCKGVCDKTNIFVASPSYVVQVSASLAYVNTTALPCPLISGSYSSLITGFDGAPTADPDPFLSQQANAALSSNPLTVSLLGMLGLSPPCSMLAANPTYYAYSSGAYTLELNGSRSSSVGGLIALKAGTILQTQSPSRGCNCDTNLIGTATTCTPDFASCVHLAQTTATCAPEQTWAAAYPASRVAFASSPAVASAMSDSCKAVVTSTVNQPSAAQLQALQMAYPHEDPASAFYVPPAPGFPPLAGGGVSQPAFNGKSLCAFQDALDPTKVHTADTSLGCLFAQVDASLPAVPSIAKSRCRAAFNDMLCSSAFMKLEFTTICTNPVGSAFSCGASDAAAMLTGTGIPFTYALPRFPGNAICMGVHTECQGFIESLGAPGTPLRTRFEMATNCSQPVSVGCDKNAQGWSTSLWPCNNPANGLPQFPDGSQQLVTLAPLRQLFTNATSQGISVSALLPLLAIGSSTVTSPSISNFALPASAVGNFSVQSLCSCPAPLLVPDSPLDDTVTDGFCCQQACTGHMYGPSEFNLFLILQKVLGSLSLVGASFVFLTWLLFKSKRQQGLTLWFAGVSLLVTLAFLIPPNIRGDPFDYHNQVFCKTPTVGMKQEDGGVCLFQGIWISYFGVCACAWWLCQAVDLFLRIYWNMRHVAHLNKYYHLFSWGLPAIVTLIFGATNSFGYYRFQGQAWCFLRDRPGNSNYELGLELGVFYGIILAMWTVGIVLMGFVIKRIYQITSRANDLANNSNAMKRLSVYRTPLAFVFIFFYYWASVFGWRFNLARNTDSYIEAGTAWATCLLSNAAAGIPDPATDPLADNSLLWKYGRLNNTGCGSKLPLEEPLGSVVYAICIIVSQGMFVFAIYGLKSDVFNLWKEKLGLTSKKYDTTAQHSSTDPTSGQAASKGRSFLRMFSSSSPTFSGSGARGNPSSIAVIGGGLKSGEFMAVDERPGHGNNAVAAYMESVDERI